MQEPLVSIIMPAYNARLYIKQAIQSVLDQTYHRWELLIINDGSTDGTEDIVLSFKDSRIQYYTQSNKGVSSARNLGLAKAQGEFICFLDADDLFTPDNLAIRVKLFLTNPRVDFVDGGVYVTGADTGSVKKIWYPGFKGNPQKELVRLRENCFITITWMIRRGAISDIRFEEKLSHAEDLLFLTEISPNRYYDYVPTPIFFFRRTGNSAMTNLDGLANGYVNLLKFFTEKKLFPQSIDRSICKTKILKIMLLSYISGGQWKKGISFVFRNLFL